MANGLVEEIGAQERAAAVDGWDPADFHRKAAFQPDRRWSCGLGLPAPADENGHACLGCFKQVETSPRHAAGKFAPCG